MCRKLTVGHLGLVPMREAGGTDRGRRWGAGASGALADSAESCGADLALPRLKAWLSRPSASHLGSLC